jgi:hypothetical protein
MASRFWPECVKKMAMWPCYSPSLAVPGRSLWKQGTYGGVLFCAGARPGEGRWPCHSCSCGALQRRSSRHPLSIASDSDRVEWRCTAANAAPCGTVQKCGCRGRNLRVCVSVGGRRNASHFGRDEVRGARLLHVSEQIQRSRRPATHGGEVANVALQQAEAGGWRLEPHLPSPASSVRAPAGFAGAPGCPRATRPVGAMAHNPSVGAPFLTVSEPGNVIVWFTPDVRAKSP